MKFIYGLIVGVCMFMSAFGISHIHFGSPTIKFGSTEFGCKKGQQIHWKYTGVPDADGQHVDSWCTQ